MKRLIVHADDLGADEARNAGIFAAIEAGAVTAASILVNGDGFADTLRRIACFGGSRVSWGVHLNLTEGKPLSFGLNFITDATGCFLGKRRGRRLLLNRGDSALAEEIRREFAAQIGTLRDFGVAIDHLDGHQHIHIFPAALEAAIWAVEKFKIPWIRIPQEPPCPQELPSDDRNADVEARFFSDLAEAARIRLSGVAVSVTDHFRGLYLKDRFSFERLAGTLQVLPSGLTELMVHPGRASMEKTHSPFGAFSSRERENELEILLDGRFRQVLELYQIHLSPFPETAI